MTIPKFNETMLPILKIVSDGSEYTLDEIVEKLYDVFKVTEEEKSIRTGSGGLAFKGKVGWGKTYLTQAGLIYNPKRGYTQITKEGKKVLKENLDEISVQYLKKYDSFVKFMTPKGTKNENDSESEKDNYTPIELIEEGYIKINNALKNELLEKLKETNPFNFEKIILELFKKMGYGEFENTPKTRDGGIDGIISQDKLGIERIYTQAKRFSNTKVSEKDIRNFIGSMSSEVSKGIFVTTSDFDKKAIEKAKNDKHHIVRLINGEELVELMIKYNIGVYIKETFEYKKLDLDFFEEL